MVERWFRDLTGKALRRGVFKLVPDLIAAIEAYLAAHNDDPKPFVWTATAEDILRESPPGPGRSLQDNHQLKLRHYTRFLTKCTRCRDRCVLSVAFQNR